MDLHARDEGKEGGRRGGGGGVRVCVCSHVDAMRDSVRLVVPLRGHSEGGIVRHANRRIERRVQEALALRCACELDARRLALMVEEGAVVVVDRRGRGRVKEVRGDGTAIRRGGLRRVLTKERRPEAARLVVLRLIAREAELDGR